MRDFAQVISRAIRQSAGIRSAVALVGVSLASMGRAEGQSDTPAEHTAAASQIALLDVKHVLEHHAAFQRRKEELDAGVALAEATIQQRKREIDQLAQRLKNLEAGSPEHTELDLNIIRQSAELKTQIDRAREKFVRESTRAHAEAYQEVVRAVNEYLDETEFRIVLRANTVVFAQPGVDITGEILRRLNEDRQKTAGRMRKPSRR